MIAYDRLSQIIPSDQALAAKSVATGLQQITGITNMTLPALARAVSGLQTVTPNSQIANLNSATGAVPSDRANILINIAGTDGKPVVVCDVLGVAAGYKIPGNLTTTVATLANTNVTYLTTVYQTMNNAVNGQYNTGNIVLIPGGTPGAGEYTDINYAFEGESAGNVTGGPGLIPVAQIEIGNIANNSAAQVAVLNNNFTSMAAQIQQEQSLQANAQIDFGNLVADNNSTVFSLISNLPTYGQQVEPGGQAQFWSGVANQSTFTGQAIVATLKEGVNQAALDAAGIQTNSTIPATPNSN